MKAKFPTAQAAVKKGTVAMLCMLLAGLLFTSKVKAQEWFPVGAKWTYSARNYGPPPPPGYFVAYMECIKDTIIEGIMAKVLVGGDACTISYYPENIFYYNDTADILYYYIKGVFRPYFDFSKKEGESYYMYFPYNFMSEYHDSVLVTVDSVILKPFGGINVRYQYISIDKRGYFISFLDLNPIVEYAGGLGCIYPKNSGCDYVTITDLRCYSDNTFSYYADPIFKEQGCDIKLSVKELVKETFAVFPNPAMDNIQIKTNKEVLQYGTIRIVNPVGQVLATHVLTSNEENISISHLSSGIYFIQYKSDNQTFQTKFIKIK